MEQRVIAPMSLPLDTDTHTLVQMLARPTRSEDAYWLLLSRGESALPAVRDGLRHPDATVRYQCCRVLDHYLTEDVLPGLVGMLNDDDPRVLIQVLHSLTCERCKEGACRPDAVAVLSGAMRLMEHNPSPRVRAMAAEVVGAAAHESEDALQALERVRASDPSAAVRKKISWYLPGGSVHKRTAPGPASGR
jgi:HEAT repeat protein